MTSMADDILIRESFEACFPLSEAAAEEERSVAVAALRLYGLSEETVQRLVHLRERLEAGSFIETDGEYRRLLFARYLYRQGRLEG